MGGRDTWHPRDFTKTLNELEQAGPQYKERANKTRGLIEPFKLSGRLYDVPDF